MGCKINRQNGVMICKKETEDGQLRSISVNIPQLHLVARSLVPETG